MVMIIEEGDGADQQGEGRGKKSQTGEGEKKSSRKIQEKGTKNGTILTTKKTKEY